MAPTLTITERIELGLSSEAAWSALTDPYVIVSCVPGAEILEITSGAAGEIESIRGSLTVSLGPAATRFVGDIRPTFDHPGRTGTLTGQGSDGRGRTRAMTETSFRLTPSESSDERCLLEIESEITVGGALAGFAKAGGRPLARRLIVEFAGNLAERARATDDSSSSVTDVPQQLGGIGLVGRALKDVIRGPRS